MKPRPRPTPGFTLIELLIVVAIIAILAAIAVPNFLEAQTRSKVSRVISDLRTIGIAVQAYQVDNGRYPRQPPPMTCVTVTQGLPQLTTPIAYLTSYPMDVFPDITDTSTPGSAQPHPIRYGMCTSGSTYCYLWSVGPDRSDDHAQTIYDPTNGTTSGGDIKWTTAAHPLTITPQL